MAQTLPAAKPMMTSIEMTRRRCHTRLNGDSIQKDATIIGDEDIFGTMYDNRLWNSWKDMNFILRCQSENLYVHIVCSKLILFVWQKGQVI